MYKSHALKENQIVRVSWHLYYDGIVSVM